MFTVILTFLFFKKAGDSYGMSTTVGCRYLRQNNDKIIF